VTNRPAIPTAVQRDILFEARHRCAVCCEPTPLERAHVRPWRKSKDHSAANLIALCANCHERADNEHWGEEYLSRYKKTPCALAAHAMPVMTAEQRAIVDLVISAEPDSMTEVQRLRFVSMMAAYAGAQLGDIRLLSVTQANSSRIKLDVPAGAARKIAAGFEQRDPMLQAFLEDFEVLRVEVVAATGEGARTAQTDVSEKGLETLIVRHLTGTSGLSVAADQPAEAPHPDGSGYLAGSPKDFDRAHAIDVAQLFAFLHATQPDTLKKLGMADASDPKDINRLKFLTRLSAEIGKRGVIDVIRKGIEHHPAGHFDLFYGTPSEGNDKAASLYARNRFSITRQLAYSTDEARRALDLCLFINGLPVATFELKNSLTKQTVEDAVEQYRRDRDPRERLFEFGRCVVHFAVDDSEVRMCPELKGKGSWFLPFNKGYNDGAGNPSNPLGLKTDYLWRDILTPKADS
jgi:type I restriction enzyme, R subunit